MSGRINHPTKRNNNRSNRKVNRVNQKKGK